MADYLYYIIAVNRVKFNTFTSKSIKNSPFVDKPRQKVNLKRKPESPSLEQMNSSLTRRKDPK